MSFKKGQNPNHPKKGAAIKVEPIRDLNAIARIKKHLLKNNNIRDHCLFTLGINTAWRANELLSIKVGDVRYLKEKDALELKQSKNKKYRTTLINQSALQAIQLLLVDYKLAANNDAPLFLSKHSKRISRSITVPTLTNLVKGWCKEAGLHGNYGSHTLRKTWGYHQRITYGVPTVLLMKAFGHATERQTLEYLGIMAHEISDLYSNQL